MYGPGKPPASITILFILFITLLVFVNSQGDNYDCPAGCFLQDYECTCPEGDPAAQRPATAITPIYGQLLCCTCSLTLHTAHDAASGLLPLYCCTAVVRIADSAPCLLTFT
jgi:hypothetical protein